MEVIDAGIKQRLPAYGREVRDAMRAGLRPALAMGTVAVCIGWPRPCTLTNFAKVVLLPEEAEPDEWKLGYLAGAPVIVWTRRCHRAYAEAIRRRLVEIGCSVYVGVVPEGYE